MHGLTGAFSRRSRKRSAVPNRAASRISQASVSMCPAQHAIDEVGG